MVWIQNQPVFSGSADISSEVFYSGAVNVTEVLVESVDLVSIIRYIALRALLEEVQFSKNRVVVKAMVKERR